jgi:nucleotide-binding universal stress UspA family protein
MTKRILVPLDFDSDTSIATQYAIEIAKRTGAEVTGLALVDQQTVEAEAAGAGLGAMYYAEKLQKKLSAEARAQAHHLLRGFTDELDRAGVPHPDDHVSEGVPFERIVEDMKYHDLLIAGDKSHFFYPDRERATHSLNDVVEKGAAATLVVEPEYRPIHRVVIAFDGSLTAARTMQKFANLGAFDPETLDVVVLNVRTSGDEDRAESELMLGLAASYLRPHGFKSVEAVSVEGTKVQQAILDFARRTRADLIVAGAYAKSGLSKFFFGSTAKGLIEECEIPLFLYH